MIELRVKSFITHKESESSTDCEDAYAENDSLGRYAIADGTSQSFFPKQWAELLVNHFCETTALSLDQKNWEEWLVPIQQEWYYQVEKRVNKLKQFHLTNRFDAGESAASTFIGLEVDRAKKEWKALIIGDSCLFHIGGSQLLKSYPIENFKSFTELTEAFASFAGDNHIAPEIVGDKANPGDVLILATDALAKWIMEYKETGKLEDALTQLNRIETDKQFCQFVDCARLAEDIPLEDDDVTLMMISVEEAEIPQPIRKEVMSTIFWFFIFGTIWLLFLYLLYLLIPK